MHEYSLIQALVERVEQEARSHGAASVHRLSVRIGEMAGVDVGLFTTAYDTFRPRTICADAALDVTVVPTVWACRACDTAIERGQPLRCPVCGQPARMVSGDEIMLDRVELEVSHV
jgi:hydrogenase nickel incorporation protein HypA/HybF